MGIDHFCEYIGGLPATGQCRRCVKSDAGQPPSAPHTCNSESSSGACFLLHLQRSTEMGKSGPRINGDLLCSVQRAVCSVCVHDRHRCLHEYALTSCDRMAPTSLQLPPRLPLTSRLWMQETDNKQMITCASSCSCPCAACCAVVAPVPAPVSPWRSCRAMEGSDAKTSSRNR